ncbi:BRO family protein [Endozoicomonas sp. 2B-B]
MTPSSTSRYSQGVLAKSGTGIGTPFMLKAHKSPFPIAAFFVRNSCAYLFMVGRVGQPSGWPGSFGAGSTNPARFASIMRLVPLGGGLKNPSKGASHMSNSLLPDRLEFEGTELTVVDHKGRPCLTSSDLSNALGYKTSNSVTKIYERNSDEFSSDMVDVVKLGTSGNLQSTTRIFSPRGCHLIAMFARTPKAKAFRKWVLDVLDHLTDTPAKDFDSVSFGREALAVWNPATQKAEFSNDYFLSSHFRQIRLLPKLFAFLQQQGLPIEGAIIEYNALCEHFSDSMEAWQIHICKIEALNEIARRKI